MYFLKGVGLLIVLLGSCLCLFRLYMVSCRFLYVLIGLEQLNSLLLLGRLVVGLPGERTYFVSLLVIFTVEAVVGLVVLVRI